MPEDINKALALCPNLEFCSISVITPDLDSLVTQSNGIAEIVLPKLRTLEVKSRSTGNEHTFQLFEKLSAPALRHLSYERSIFMYRHSPTPGDFDPDRLSSSISFLLRKLIHPLEELELCFSFDKSLKDILVLVPDVKRLSLRESSVPRSPGPLGSSTLLDDDHVLELFTPTGDDELPTSSCVCPNLEVFHCGAVFFSNRRLFNFLRARSVDHEKHNFAHLKGVGMSFIERLSRNPNDEEDMNIEDEIKALGKKTGMVVDLQYPSGSTLPPIPAHGAFYAWRGLDCSSPLDTGRFVYSGLWDTPCM